MYGDQFRSPGRDDRQDGTAPQRAAWETGHAAPHREDVKVAGSHNSAPPGFYDASVREDAPGPQGAGGPEANTTTAYGMGTPYEQGGSYEQPGNPYGTGVPYEAGATSAMPPPHFDGADAPPARAFRDMRRTPRTSNKRVVRFAAAAAAVAVVGGGGVAWAISGGSGGKPQAASQTQAQVPPPAPLTDAQRKDAEDQRRKELKKQASRAARNQLVRPTLVAKGTPPPTPKPSSSSASGTAGDPVPVGEAQQIARAMLPSFGWSPSSQFGCLVNLWDKESGWNTHASNPSGAYGIPQALPGSKMASAGPDWQNNARTQIKWGFGYIRDRYSTPCGAWGHSQSTGWY